MGEKTKVAVVYTGMPLSLAAMVEEALKEALSGEAYTLITFANPCIIDNAITNGSPSEGAASDLAALYMAAAQQGAKIILNACSSVGEIADAAQPLMAKMGVRLIRIDEDMARAAAGAHRRIGVVATLRSTLAPTVRLVQRAAAEAGRPVEVLEILADNTFGLEQAALEQALIERSLSARGSVDCLLLAQGSMAACEREIARATGLLVYSSPRYGAAAVSRALRA
jgi:hypothetical protein